MSRNGWRRSSSHRRVNEMTASLPADDKEDASNSSCIDTNINADDHRRNNKSEDQVVMNENPECKTVSLNLPRSSPEENQNIEDDAEHAINSSPDQPKPQDQEQLQQSTAAIGIKRARSTSVPSRKKKENGTAKSAAKRRCNSHSKNQRLVDQQEQQNLPKNEFVQRGPCPCEPRCLECQLSAKPRSSKSGPRFECRFKGFRKLIEDDNGQLVVAGFCSPATDLTKKDQKLWLPSSKEPPQCLELDTAKIIISQLGDRFCELVSQEMEAVKAHQTRSLGQKEGQNEVQGEGQKKDQNEGHIKVQNEGNIEDQSQNEVQIEGQNEIQNEIQNEKGQDDSKVKIVCKLLVNVREMCDVCETTLFNYHWTCSQCGFVICIACYQSLLETQNSFKDLAKDEESCCIIANINTPLKESNNGNDSDKTSKGSRNLNKHDLSKLMLTQIIAGNCLTELGRLMHQMRHVWSIPQYCDCPEAREYLLMNEAGEMKNDAEISAGTGSNPTSNNTVESSSRNLGSSSDSDSEVDDSFSKQIMMSCMTQHLKQISGAQQVKDDKTEPNQGPGSEQATNSPPLKPRDQNLLPIRVWTLSESRHLYPNLSHSWLCAGRLLKLEDPADPSNVHLFQDMWKRGQPVLVANVHKRLSKGIWTPQSFSEDYGDLRSDLVNCLSGKTVRNKSLKRFWDGFDLVKERLVDGENNRMLLKLKDWPAGEDFAKFDPKRFKDLMRALPLKDYTDRNGRLNLAARLPSNFVKPDLGPKMYIAYGSGLHLEKGTTNLHLDISDAVNVMVHVGVPKDVDNTEHLNCVREAIRDSDCDTLTIMKVTQDSKMQFAGALWHIYNSRDADKIRDLLNKVAVESGKWLEHGRDPIHDQTYYLDRQLRKRLMEEYNVSGYPIIQCLGDAVFIPAGAPHQVRNLNNCIKIAEDFVSPENVSHCFHLTEEFRRLSDSHMNHEDKLQIKNIIHHAVKDAVSVLMFHSEQKEEDEDKLEQ